MKTKVALALAVSAFLVPLADYSPASAQTDAKDAPLQSALPDYIKEKGKLFVALDCGAPPYAYKDPSGKIVGAEVDIARKIAELSFGPGAEPDLTCVAPASRIPYLTTKKVDIVIAQLSMSPERAKVVGFSKPYFATSAGFIVKKGNEFSKLSELEGKTVTTASSYYFDFFKKACDVHWDNLPLATTSLTIDALEAGRAKAYIADITRAYEVYTKNPNLTLSGPDLRALTGQANAIGFRKDELKTGEWLDKAMDLMQQSDFIWTDFKKWMGPGQLELLAKLDAIPRPNHTPDYKKLFPTSYEAVSGCPVN